MVVKEMTDVGLRPVEMMQYIRSFPELETVICMHDGQMYKPDLIRNLLDQLKAKRAIEIQGPKKVPDLSVLVKEKLKTEYGVRNCEITVRDGKDQKFPGAVVRYVSNHCIFKENSGSCSTMRQHRLWAWMSGNGKVEFKCNGCTKKTSSPVKKK